MSEHTPSWDSLVLGSYLFYLHGLWASGGRLMAELE